MVIGVESHSGEIIFGCRAEVPRLNSSDFVNHSYDYRSNNLRTVPTIVTAHTFCASPDTLISYRQCLLIQGSFCAV